MGTPNGEPWWKAYHDAGGCGGSNCRCEEIFNLIYEIRQQGMEALKERGILRQNAPHLVSELACIVPSYAWWEGPFYGIGLKLYELLAGKYGFGKSQKISRARLIASQNASAE